MTRILSALASVFLLALGVALAADPKETDTNFDNHKALAVAIAKADRVILYEGLPHQTFEQQLLQEELKNKKTVKLNDFPFYTETLSLKDADAKSLKALFIEAAAFKQYSGPKRCGGFHPDYALEWHVGKDVYRAQICFGCQEVKIFGPKSEVHCDMRPDTNKQLQATLKPYRKNRPKAE
jgi:hypothetical protein